MTDDEENARSRRVRPEENMFRPSCGGQRTRRDKSKSRDGSVAVDDARLVAEGERDNRGWSWLLPVIDEHRFLGWAWISLVPTKDTWRAGFRR